MCCARAFVRTHRRLVPARWLIGGIILLLLTPVPLPAQPAADGPTLETPLKTGVQALRQDNPGRAASLLTTVVDAQPGYVSPDRGAAAYWLGLARQQQERMDDARTAWINGHRAVTSNGAFDVRLADAYLRSIFTDDTIRPDRAAAAKVYQQLLQRTDEALAPAEATIIRRHAAQAALLMTEDQRARLSAQALDDTSWTLRDGAGAYLTTWWRQHDPAPATPQNERIEEHLERVAIALERYPDPTRPSGLDDRGETYVRYGPPHLQREITYNDAGFVLDVFRFGVNVSSFEFPDNEVWTYPQVHHAAYFIFIEEEKDRYRVGSSADLIPRRLASAFSNSERHLNRAVSALAAMEYIFRDLALYHPDFGTLYDKIANYANWQEMNATQYRATGRVPAGTTMRTVGSGIGQQRHVFSSPAFGIGTPSQFIQRTSMEQKTLDARARQIRQQVLPPQTTRIFGNLDSLSLMVRTARFLEPNGATRTEVYWGTLARHLRPDDEEHAGKNTLVKLTAVEYTDDFDRRRTRNKWYNTSAATDADGLMVPGGFSLTSAADTYHLGLQWEQYAADLSGDHVRLDDQLRVATRRLDTLSALRATPDQLEMSDLKPLRTGADFMARGASLDAATPYPFARIAPDASLLLYFELYHLGLTDDAQTRYTVEYDVMRRTERGRLARLFRGDKEDRTTARTTYEGDSRTAREQILIDLSEWQDEQSGTLTITVRVTDEVTGQQVERSIDFEVQPRPESS